MCACAWLCFVCYCMFVYVVVCVRICVSIGGRESARLEVLLCFLCVLVCFCMEFGIVRFGSSVCCMFNVDCI